MNLEDVDLAQRIQCFSCGEFFLGCECKTRFDGENRQYMLDDDDLPPLDSPFDTNFQFWMRLVKLGGRTSVVDVDLFYTDQQKVGLFDLLKNADLKYRFYVIWDAYSQSEHFIRVVAPNFQLLGLEKLKRVGKEALDSYFSGRWWELSIFSIALVMNSLEVCGPDPRAPETRPMRFLADALQFVELVITQVSQHQVFTLVASERVTTMKNLAAYTRVPNNLPLPPDEPQVPIEGEKE